MDIRLADDSIIELTKERKKAIKEYTELQEWFKELAKAGVCRNFVIKYLNNELDIDSLTETQKNKLDNCKDARSRELMLEWLPRIDRAYDLLNIVPYWIWHELDRKDLNICDLTTEIIQAINERIKYRLDIYKDLIDND